MPHVLPSVGLTWGDSFTYDGMGNVTNDGANTYTYDAEGRPITAAGVQTTFDPLGRALEQNRSGSYTQVVYAPSGQKFAFMNGTTLIKYIDPMVAGMAAVHNGPNGTPPNSGYFQHADWLGSSRWAQDGGGNVTYDRAYAPFGESYAETLTTNRDFTGQTQDTTPGLYDFLFRQQSSAQGRWLVPDPSFLSFAWVGVLTFVGARTHSVIQNSKSLSNQDKIPAQAKPAWTGHPHVSSITGVLGWATRPTFLVARRAFGPARDFLRRGLVFMGRTAMLVWRCSRSA